MSVNLTMRDPSLNRLLRQVLHLQSPPSENELYTNWTLSKDPHESQVFTIAIPRYCSLTRVTVYNRELEMLYSLSDTDLTLIPTFILRQEFKSIHEIASLVISVDWRG